MKKLIISIVALFLVIGCKKQPFKVAKITGNQIAITSKLEQDSSYIKVYLPYKKKVDKEMQTTISYTPINLTATDAPLESSLGNLLADLCYEQINPLFKNKFHKNIDFAMFNFNGIRASIPKGNVTNNHAFNLMPFENKLVVVELNYNQLQQLIKFLISEKKAHPLSKQVKLTLSKNKYTFLINNKPLNKAKSYFVLTSDYLQHGGDHMIFFKHPISIFDSQYKMRNAIIDYFKAHDTLKVKLDHRFYQAD
ncbi:MAG: 5'-nucleotidase C-terminal domain-containing protein [Lutibacter sp.]